jgi:hypothetical protein
MNIIEKIGTKPQRDNINVHMFRYPLPLVFSKEYSYFGEKFERIEMKISIKPCPRQFRNILQHKTYVAMYMAKNEHEGERGEKTVIYSFVRSKCHSTDLHRRTRHH